MLLLLLFWIGALKILHAANQTLHSYISFGDHELFLRPLEIFSIIFQRESILSLLFIFISDHPIALNSPLARWKHMIYLHLWCRLWCSAAASVLPYMSVAMLFLPKSIKYSFRMYPAQCQVCLWHIKYMSGTPQIITSIYILVGAFFKLCMLMDPTDPHTFIIKRWFIIDFAYLQQTPGIDVLL